MTYKVVFSTDPPKATRVIGINPGRGEILVDLYPRIIARAVGKVFGRSGGWVPDVGDPLSGSLTVFSRHVVARRTNDVPPGRYRITVTIIPDQRRPPR